MTFVMNAWYVAAWSSEVGEKDLFGRTLLNEPVLIYRALDGTVVAMNDRCPHRFAALHRGTRNGDRVACPYHGLTYDRHGQCVFSPHGDGRIPPRARVPTYVAVEKHGGIWIWMGDPARADPELIPNYAFLAEGSPTASLRGYLHNQADYLLLIDNILDLSHADFLHPGFLSSAGGVTRQAPKVVDVPRGFALSWEWSDQPPMGVFGLGLPGIDRTDGWLSVEWGPVANMRLESGATPTGRPRSEGVSLRAVHCMTPETATTSHYFYGSRRDFSTDDAALTETLAVATRHAFVHEDKPMIERVQQYMRGAEFWSLKPVVISSDVGGLRARKSIGELLRVEEANPAPPSDAIDASARATN